MSALEKILIRKGNTVKQKVIQIIMVVVFLGGLGLFMYPKATQWYAAYQNEKAMESFTESKQAATGKIPEEKQKSTVTDKSHNSNSLEELWEDMTEYNQTLYEQGQKELKDPFAYEMPSFVLKDYGIQSEVFGTIEIPAMDVKLPLYLGATKENMSKGGVILGQTSMPLGGENTNVVIAAHRGYKGIPMFREIQKLTPGDYIKIVTLFDTLTYQVSECKVIEPDQVNEILIKSGEDRITLLTCHPYTKNTHRYLVVAKRCENQEQQIEGQTEEKELTQEKETDTALSEIKQEKESENILWLERYIPVIGMAGILLLVAGGIIVTRKKK